MKISTRGRYALRMVIEIARISTNGKPVPLREISESQDISKRYLEQLVIDLRRAKLIKSVYGKNGGYLLAKPASDIKVLEVVEATIGPISIINCITNRRSCKRSGNCLSADLWTSVNSRIRSALGEVSIADLAFADRDQPAAL